jgi:transposase-like protein
VLGTALREAFSPTDRCEETGQVGSLLRREGLYASYLTTWRRQREEGILSGLNKKRGRKESPANPLAERIATLEKENTRLRQELEKASLIIDVQKKVSLLLGVSQENQGGSV